MLVKRFLQRVHLPDAAEAFDRLDAAAVGLPREHQASTRAVAIDQHGAGAADAVLAADMGAGQAQRVTQEICEEKPGFHGGAIRHAIDGDADLAGLAHAALSLARRKAAANARPVSTPAR